MKYALLSLFIILALAANAFEPSNTLPVVNQKSVVDIAVKTGESFVARLDNPSDADFGFFQRAKYDICAYHPGLYLDVLVNEDMFRELQLNYSGIYITQTEAQLKANLKSTSRDLPGYRNYQTMLDELMVLQAMYPNLVRVESIGESWGSVYAAQNIPAYLAFDHQIWAVKLSNNVEQIEDEPAFYFVGEHHAREPISLETVMGILVHLLEGYGIDPEITDIVNTSEIWFVPLLNPDGHKLVINESNVWWRKNIFDNNANSIIETDQWGYGADGADLNRNYGYKWGYVNASGDPYEVTYHGASPFSEIETQAFRDLLLSRKFIAGISYHTYGEYVLYPLGFMSNIVSPDAEEMQALAVAMASSIPRQGSGTYTPMPSYSLYPVSGSSEDWVYGERGIFGYTIEMADEFIPPAADVPTIVANNLNAAKILLSRKNSKMLKGHVTDALTGTALEAMIFVEGIDDNPLKTIQTYSEPVFGAYYRFLPVGTHRVNYLCEGYASFSMMVNITADAVSIADVALLQAEQLNLALRVCRLDGTPIEGASISFVDSEIGAYVTNASGQIYLTNFNAGMYRMIIAAEGFEMLHRTHEIASPNYTFYLSEAPAIVDDFETELVDWYITGNWGRSSINFNSGTYSLSDSPVGNYQNNRNVHCRLIQPIDLRLALNANLQFMAMYSINLDGDYCQLSYSVNGTDWTYLADFMGVSPWQQYSYSLNHLIGNQVYLRFSMITTNSGTGDGIYIDDLKLFVTGNSTPLTDEVSPVIKPQLLTHPNPFSGKLSINVTGIKQNEYGYQLDIYNVKGQLVRTIPINNVLAKETSVEWNGKDNGMRKCANGIYFVKLNHRGNSLCTAKTILIK